MKTFFPTLGLLVLCTACNQSEQKPFVLQGELADCQSTYAILMDARIDLNDTIQVTSEGTFYYQKTFAEPTVSFFYLPEEETGTMIIAANGTTNRLTGNAKDIHSLKISGDLEAAYPFYAEMGDALGNALEEDAPDFNAYRTRLLHTGDSIRQAVKEITNQGFQQLVNNLLAESIGMGLVGYDDLLAAKGKMPDEDAAYTDYMESIDLNDSINLQNGHAQMYLQWVSNCQTKRNGLSYLTMLKTIEQKVTRQDICNRLVKRLMAGFESGDDAQLDSICMLAEQLLTPEEDKAWIRQKHATLAGIKPGMQAIDCEWTDPEGKVSRLSDLYGKVIYLDVWATWCGPCCAEIPYLEKLVEHFKNDNRLEIVSVSVDNNREAWLKKLETDRPQWKQFLNEDFCTLYGIGGIPRFMLIGKDGKFISPNAPRPSDEHIIRFIESHL